jgi:hypothetical protein
MGRWGSGILESDGALDYLSTITDLLEHEIFYICSEERVSATEWWLGRIVTVLEMILLIEQYDNHSTVYLDSVKAIQRWRQAFFGVWDGDWREEDQYSQSAFVELPYRTEHRPAVSRFFERLEVVAGIWEESSPKTVEIPPLLEAYPLPYFSIHRWINRDNKEIVNVERFTGDTLIHLQRDIIFWLSPEKRGEMAAVNAEEVWVAVDLLAFLCEKYEQSPGVNAQIVNRWRETTVEIWKQFLVDDKAEWDDTDPLYQNVMRAFDRLEAVAHKYPAYEW